jgi:hypothetical protein
MQGEAGESWRELCEQAAVEQDAHKLLQLIREINELLEAKERRLQRQLAARRGAKSVCRHHASQPETRPTERGLSIPRNTSLRSSTTWTWRTSREHEEAVAHSRVTKKSA